MSSFPTHPQQLQQRQLQLQQEALNVALRRVLESNFDSTSQTCLLIILKIIDGILKQPYNAKVRTLRLSNPTIQSKIGGCHHGLSILAALGFVTVPPPTTGRLGNLAGNIIVGSGDHHHHHHIMLPMSMPDPGPGPGPGTAVEQEQEQDQNNRAGTADTAAMSSATTTSNSRNMNTNTPTNGDGNPESLSPAGLIQARRTIQRVLVEELKISADLVPPMPTISLAAFPSMSSSTSSSSSSTTFNIYQGRRHDGQAAAIGTSLGPPPGWKSQTEQELELLQQKRDKLLLQTRQDPNPKNANSKNTNASNASHRMSTTAPTTINRKWKAWRDPSKIPIVGTIAATTATTGTTTTTAADSSPSDAALLAGHLQKQQLRRQAEDNRGFTTKAMRDLQRLKTRRVYTSTMLRFQFVQYGGGPTTAVVVMGEFHPHETIGTVLDALRRDVFSIPPPTTSSSSTSSSSSSSPFLELFQTPPKTILPPDKTLEELSLVPAAKLFVGWKWGGTTTTAMNATAASTSATTTTTTSTTTNDNREEGWFIQPHLFQDSAPHHPSSTTDSSAPTQGDDDDGGTIRLPKGISILEEDDNEKDPTKLETKDGTNANKRKTIKTKAEKEAMWMKRMMGGGK